MSSYILYREMSEEYKTNLNFEKATSTLDWACPVMGKEMGVYFVFRLCTFVGLEDVTDNNEAHRRGSRTSVDKEGNSEKITVIDTLINLLIHLYMHKL